METNNDNTGAVNQTFCHALYRYQGMMSVGIMWCISPIEYFALVVKTNPSS